LIVFNVHKNHTYPNFVPFSLPKKNTLYVSFRSVHVSFTLGWLVITSYPVSCHS